MAEYGAMKDQNSEDDVSLNAAIVMFVPVMFFIAGFIAIMDI